MKQQVNEEKIIESISTSIADLIRVISESYDVVNELQEEAEKELDLYGNHTTFRYGVHLDQHIRICGQKRELASSVLSRLENLQALMTTWCDLFREQKHF